MRYDVASQLQYKNIAYRTKSGRPKGATISSGGCGPSAVRNLGNNLLGWGTTIPTVAQIAVDCGARYDGGTTISTLLAEMQKKYSGFEYRYSSSDTTAFNAVRKGAMCIIHTPGAVSGMYNKLLSSAGHFMCLAAVDSEYGYIIDSCSYGGKWTAQSNRKKYCTLVQSDGLVRVTLTAIRATIDYYYIVTKKQTDSTTNKTKEDDDMKYYKKLTDVPSYYKEAIQKLVNAGAMSGTGNGELNVSEDLCRIATVLNKAGVLDLTESVTYQDINDVPKWYRTAVQKMIDCGAISGTDKGNLDISEDLCRALTILDNAGLLDTTGAGMADVTPKRD